MHIGDLISEYRQKNNLTMEEFAKLIGRSKAYVSMLEKNKNSRSGKEIVPSAETLKSVSDVLGITIDDLLKILDDDQLILINPLPYPSLRPIIKKKFPILGKIACGKPIYATEEFEGFVTTDKDVDADFCLIAKGDSMIGARIFNGDVVFIKQQPVVEDGEIAAVFMDDEVTLKRFYRRDGYLELKAENPTIRPIIIHERDFETVCILGKAVAFQAEVI